MKSVQSPKNLQDKNQKVETEIIYNNLDNTFDVELPKRKELENIEIIDTFPVNSAENLKQSKSGVKLISNDFPINANFVPQRNSLNESNFDVNQKKTFFQNQNRVNENKSNNNAWSSTSYASYPQDKPNISNQNDGGYNQNNEQSNVNQYNSNPSEESKKVN